MYPEFHEFMRRKQHSDTDDLLVQAIAVITTQPAFHSYTPDDVWDKLVEQAKVVKGEVRG